MKTKKMIESWKSAEMNNVIGKSSINKDMMAEIQGGGSGYVQTLSGECNTKHLSCWKALKESINVLLEAFS
jgi:hypothetical protein